MESLAFKIQTIGLAIPSWTKKPTKTHLGCYDKYLLTVDVGKPFGYFHAKAKDKPINNTDISWM